MDYLGLFSRTQLHWRKLKKSMRAYRKGRGLTRSQKTKLPNELWFCLHRVGVEEDISFTADMTVTTKQLDRLVQFAQGLGYHFESAQGKTQGPKKAVLSFDDGYVDQFDTLGPWLKEKNLSAVVFWSPGLRENPWRAWWMVFEAALMRTKKKEIPGQCEACGKKHAIRTPVGKNRLYHCLRNRALAVKDTEMEGFVRAIALSLVDPKAYAKILDEVRDSFASKEKVRDAVAKYPIRLANHGWTHTPAQQLPTERLLQEIEHCRVAILEAAADKPVAALEKTYAFPYGEHGTYAVSQMHVLREHGFGPAFSTQNANLDGSKPVARGRIVVDRSDTSSVWSHRIADALPQKL